MKRLSLIALMMFVFASITPTFADRCPDKQCSKGEYKSACKSCGEKDCGNHPCPITSKLMKKSCFLLGNAEEIGLSDDQVKKIKTIKMDAKKQMILGEAQMKIAFIDMTAKLHEEKLDLEGLNKMVDDFSAGMAESTKKTIQSYADLKGILTDEQMKKAKEVWKKSEK